MIHSERCFLNPISAWLILGNLNLNKGILTSSATQNGTFTFEDNYLSHILSDIDHQ